MYPNRLKLINFRGILSGRDKSELEIDFNALVPREASIVALVGPNGSGKTTILDNMHPFRLMPSRASSLSPEGFSYYDHVLPECDALKELDWSHGGASYRSIIRIKSTKKTKKQECFLMVDDGSGNYAPYKGRDGLFSNGSTENYDKCVVDVIGEPEVFFASQFGAQGRKPLASMKVAEIKALLSAMLRFDRFADSFEMAKSVCASIKGNLGELQRTKQDLLLEISSSRQTVQASDGLRNQAQAIHAMYASKSNALIEAERNHAVMQERHQQQERIREERASTLMRLDLAVRTVQEVESKFDVESEKLEANFRTSADHAKKRAMLANSAWNDANARFQEAMKIAAQKEKLDQAKIQQVNAKQKLSDLRMEIDNLGFKPDRVASMRDNLNKLREMLSGDIANSKNLSATIEMMRRTASVVEEVPCKGTDLAGACKLLSDGLKAANALPESEQSFLNLRQKCDQIKVEGVELRSQLDILLQAEKRHFVLTEEVRSTELQIANLSAVLTSEEQVNNAVASLSGLEQGVAEKGYQCQEANLAVQAEAEKLSTWRQQRAQEKVSQLEGAKLAEASVRKELAGLPQLVESTEVAAAQKAVETVKFEIEALAKQRADLDSRLRAIQSVAEKLIDLDASLKKCEKREKAYGAVLSLWTLLQLALSKNGILAMELDDASPAIAAHTNALLDECYGGRFTVQLVTQKATATGVMKEDFEVIVEDTLRGEIKPLDRMSGGEKVWINECLVRGITLYMSNLGDLIGGVLFSDETDGPLDESRKRQFMAMKRACLRVGGYEREYVITQTPELWDMCDACIDVSQL